MRLRRGAILSLRTLLAHKVRASLAVASVSAGVAAVVVTSAIGTGMQRDVLRRIESMGTNLLIVRPAEARRSVARGAIMGTVRTLDLEDSVAITQLVRVADAAPAAEGVALVKAGTLATMATVRGTTTAFPSVRRLTIEAGRFFGEEDIRASRRVVVIGGRARATLFPDADPVGREVRIRGVPFEVVGALDAKGVQADGSDEDNHVFVPITTALRRVFNSTWLDVVYVSARGSGELDEAEREIRSLLRERHGLHGDGPEGDADDFQIQNTTRFLAIQQQMADSLARLAAGLGALALLVGGAGIFALMFLSVRERTSEIGLRMAVGAKPRDVLLQFLLEAAILALGGWLAGVTLGGIGAAAVAMGTEWAVAVPVEALAASFAMAVAIGLGFGALPARKASRIPPVRALLAR
jgi:putative ABC transport system permease protein